MARLCQKFYAGNTVEIARKLLGKLLVRRLEDGTLLWVSDLIAPGESSAPIVLSTPLAAGEYKNAVLKYECFRMDEALTPLNGATANLTIKVK